MQATKENNYRLCRCCTNVVNYNNNNN